MFRECGKGIGRHGSELWIRIRLEGGLGRLLGVPEDGAMPRQERGRPENRQFRKGGQDGTEMYKGTP